MMVSQYMACNGHENTPKHHFHAYAANGMRLRDYTHHNDNNDNDDNGALENEMLDSMAMHNDEKVHRIVHDIKVLKQSKLTQFTVPNLKADQLLKNAFGCFKQSMVKSASSSHS